MTKVEEILTAAYNLYHSGHSEVSQDIVRQRLELSHKMWHSGYSNTFQAMCKNCGKGLVLRQEFQNVFEKIRHGRYQFSDYGLTLVQDRIQEKV